MEQRTFKYNLIILKLYESFISTKSISRVWITNRKKSLSNLTGYFRLFNTLTLSLFSASFLKKKFSLIFLFKLPYKKSCVKRYAFSRKNGSFFSSKMRRWETKGLIMQKGGGSYRSNQRKNNRKSFFLIYANLNIYILKKFILSLPL